MNKQRKVVITTTYNEMGIIIDTKVEEVAQPNLQPTIGPSTNCSEFPNNSDTISRQAAIDAFNTDLTELVVGGEKNAKTVENYLNGVLDKIKCLPSAEPKRGKWILHTYLPHHNYCSICEKDSPYNKRWNFCPNCGAKMEE